MESAQEVQIEIKMKEEPNLLKKKEN